MILSPQQENMRIIAKDRGFIDFKDRSYFYATEEAYKNAIFRLVSLGILREDPDRFGRFIYCEVDKDE